MEGEERRRLSVQFSPPVGKTVGKLSRIDRVRNKGVKIIVRGTSERKFFYLCPEGRRCVLLDGEKWESGSWSVGDVIVSVAKEEKEKEGKCLDRDRDQEEVLFDRRSDASYSCSSSRGGPLMCVCGAVPILGSC